MLCWPRSSRSVKLDPSSRASRKAGAGVPGAITLMGRASLAQAELFDQRPIALEVGALQVVQKAPPAAHEHEQPAPRVVVFALLAQVLGEMVDALGQQRDLHLRGAGVLLARAEGDGYLAL